MNTTEVIIIRTGSANLASVRAAFDRLGVPSRVSDEPACVASAPLVVLPGVGAFGAAMSHLHAQGLVAPLRERICAARPLLAICLGLQLLCDDSDESPGVAGLGVVSGRISRFPADVRRPQMGWNTIAPMARTALLRPDWMYFANSFRLEHMPDGWTGATTHHGGSFVSALQRGPILACQFHPELSGPAGLSLIDRWLALASGKGPLSC